MKKQDKPKARIFVCINEKQPEKAQCMKGEGEVCLKWLKDQIEARGLKSKIKATGTKCLGYCDTTGTSVVLNPKGGEFCGVTRADLPQLFEEFLETLDV